MKKLLAIFMIVLMCITLCACNNSPSTEPTEETSAHTLAPTQAENTQEEWVEIDCDISLKNADGVSIIGAPDFETFTLCGTNDEDSCIKLKLSEIAVEVLCSYTEPTVFYVYIGLDKIASANIDPATFDGVIEIGSDLSYNELCELATTIRGLFN